MIIFGGGNTDYFRPFDRYESVEMRKLFMALANRKFVGTQTRKWAYRVEKKSLSTLETLLYSRDILRREHIRGGNLYIICETLREKRAAVVGAKLFGHRFKIRMLPCDFHTDSYRYDLNLWKKAELEAIKQDLFVLKNPKYLNLYRLAFKKKVEFFKTMPDNHDRAVVLWKNKVSKEVQGRLLRQLQKKR